MTPLVSFWPHTLDRNVASTRIRCLQVVQCLGSAGLAASLYDPVHPPTQVPAVLVLAKRYDPDSIQHALALQRRAGTRLVLDICDNHFYFKQASEQWQRRAEQLRAAARAVNCVVTASLPLAEVVASECGPGTRVRVIPDALDEWPAAATPSLRERWHTRRAALFQRLHPVAPGRRLLWFGNHGAGYADGGMQDISLIEAALGRHHRAQPVRLTIISNSRAAYRTQRARWPVPTLYLPWSAWTFQRVLRQHDIALIPAQRNPFTLCKTNNRLATAFLGGLAVAADSLPAYQEFADLAVLDDWDAGLAELMAHEAARAERVRRAVQRLRERYSVQIVCRQWANLVREFTSTDDAAATQRTAAEVGLERGEEIT